MISPLLFLGVFFWLLLLTLSAAGCLIALRRRTNNRKCLVGLLIVLFTWICDLLARQYCRKALDLESLPLLSESVVIAAALGGLMTCVHGVKELSRRRRRRRKQTRLRRGMRRGRAGICLALVLIGLTSAGMVEQFFPNQKSVVGAPPNSKTIVVENLNFRFVLPIPWIQVDLPARPPGRTLTFTRDTPPMTFQITAERIDPHSDLTSSTFAEQVKANLRHTVTNANFGDERHSSQQGAEVVQFEAITNSHSEPKYHSFWVSVHRGVAYQLVCFGASDDRLEIDREAETLIAAFEILRPNDRGISLISNANFFTLADSTREHEHR
ncbi:MAG: hypothetical protein QOD99_1214 [Chthoniobacter sp.]|jgi:hypothetical protein|nr:hypothetical protein [Chthoniobacter sp.]